MVHMMVQVGLMKGIGNKIYETEVHDVVNNCGAAGLGRIFMAEFCVLSTDLAESKQTC